MVSIIEELDQLASKVDEKDLRRIERHLDPPKPGETVLGVVHNEEARKWWAASRALYAGADSCEHKAAFLADNEEEEQIARTTASRLRYLSQLAGEVFWLQAREDLGGSAWKHQVGVRAGWQLIARESTAGGRSLSSLLGAIGSLGLAIGTGGQGMPKIDLTMLPGAAGSIGPEGEGDDDDEGDNHGGPEDNT